MRDETQLTSYTVMAAPAILRCAFVVMGLCAASYLVSSAAPPNDVSAVRAASLIADGRVDEGERVVTGLLVETPNDPALIETLAAAQLRSGRFKPAETSARSALAIAPKDAFARYELGLALLASGDRPSARIELAAAAKVDDMAAVGCAYAELLSGAATELPNDASANVSARASLTVAIRATKHDWAGCLAAANSAWGPPDESWFEQPAGLTMTFAPGTPLVAAPASIVLPPPSIVSRRSSGEVGGTLALSAEGCDVAAGFVGYEIDGEAMGIVNVAPFEYFWDSRSVSNGWHTIALTFYNTAGQQLNRVERRLLVYNAEQNGGKSRSFRTVREALWAALAIRPDRRVCGYAAAMAAIASGDNELARTWLERVAAIDPDFRDTRSRLTALDASVASKPVTRVATTDKLVALTFDDGPKPGVSEPLLALLQRSRVPATFFMVGRQVSRYPALAKQTADAGMEIENHSFSHPNLALLPRNRIETELLQAQAMIRAVTGVRTKYARPPGGSWNPAVDRAIQAWGMTPCYWSVDAYTAETTSADRVASIVLDRVRPGAVVLMHNGLRTTVAALPTIIRELRNRGYRFVTIEQLAQTAELPPPPRAFIAGLQDSRPTALK